MPVLDRSCLGKYPGTGVDQVLRLTLARGQGLDLPRAVLGQGEGSGIEHQWNWCNVLCLDLF